MFLVIVYCVEIVNVDLGARCSVPLHELMNQGPCFLITCLLSEANRLPGAYKVTRVPRFGIDEPAVVFAEDKNVALALTEQAEQIVYIESPVDHG